MSAIMKVEVLSTFVDVNEGTSDKTGKFYAFYRQEGYLHIPGKPYPEKISIDLKNEASAYPAGAYQFDLAECVTVGRFGDIAIDNRRIKLKPIQQQPKAAS